MFGLSAIASVAARLAGGSDVEGTTAGKPDCLWEEAGGSGASFLNR